MKSNLQVTSFTKQVLIKWDNDYTFIVGSFRHQINEEHLEKNEDYSLS